VRSRSLVYIGVARGDMSDDGYAGAECMSIPTLTTLKEIAQR
jgi:hypothetical protein